MREQDRRRSRGRTTTRLSYSFSSSCPSSSFVHSARERKERRGRAGERRGWTEGRGVPEALLWSYLIQLLIALAHVHSRGYAGHHTHRLSLSLSSPPGLLFLFSFLMFFSLSLSLGLYGERVMSMTARRARECTPQVFATHVQREREREFGIIIIYRRIEEETEKHGWVRMPSQTNVVLAPMERCQTAPAPVNLYGQIFFSSFCQAMPDVEEKKTLVTHTRLAVSTALGREGSSLSLQRRCSAPRSSLPLRLRGQRESSPSSASSSSSAPLCPSHAGVVLVVFLSRSREEEIYFIQECVTVLVDSFLAWDERPPVLLPRLFAPPAAGYPFFSLFLLSLFFSSRLCLLSLLLSV